MHNVQNSVLKEKAKKMREKSSASTGTDIDIRSYARRAKVHGAVRSLRELPDEITERSLRVGIEADEKCRSGSFFQIDHSVILATAYREGLEVMDISEARTRYGWLSEYWWKAVSSDADRYTAHADLEQNHGYFLRVLPGAKIELPLQACLYMTGNGLAQNVHNIIIAEEGSELNIITGCAVGKEVRRGLHIGISEFYVKKNAKITFTMIHNWSDDIAVRPRSGTIVGENGVFLSNYICMQPVRTLQMYPTAICAGNNATVRYNTILFARRGSHMDIGSRVYLRSAGSRAEVVARAITDGGEITARGHLIGEVPGIKAHLECRGLILSDRGRIHAIPELEGKVHDVDLSHEAAVGKIAEEEVRYLMARGMRENEATAAIVRGFLDVRIKGLPPHLEKEIKTAVRMEEMEEQGL